MKAETFAECMLFLESVFGVARKELLKLYREKYLNIPDDVFKSAVSRVIDTFKPTSNVPFPLPAHFNDAIGISGQNRVQLAIDAVKRSQEKGPYASISFGDRALHEAVMRFGGWPVVCNWTLEDWNYNEKKFVAAYSAEILTGNGPNYLKGLSEEHNAENFHLFNYEQKKHAIKNCKISEIRWVGYDSALKLPKPEEQLLIGLEKKAEVFGIDFKDKFDING